MFTDFALEYYRSHPWMTIEECARACELAWDRAHNQPTGDILQWWMQDTVTQLYTKRAIEKIGK